MKFLTPEERERLEALMDEANAREESQTLRAQWLVDELRSMNDEPWPASVLLYWSELSARSSLKNRLRQQSTVLVNVDTAMAVRSARGGVRQNATAGEAVQQKLFVDMTWDELEKHILMLREQIGALRVNVSIDARLLKLREQFPDSKTPGEALEALGLTLDEFLAQEEDAA